MFGLDRILPDNGPRPKTRALRNPGLFPRPVARPSIPDTQPAISRISSGLRPGNLRRNRAHPVPPLQMQVLTAAVGAPTLASSMNIGAFNLGNALGAAIGGAVIGFHWGYPAVSIGGALLSGCGLAVVLATRGHPAIGAADPALAPSNERASS